MSAPSGQPADHDFQASVTWDENWKEVLRAKDLLLLDARTDEEHAEKSIEGSVLHTVRMTEDPKLRIEEAFQVGKLSQNDKERPILVYCAAGGRAARVVEAMKQMRFTNVWNGGGIDEVRKAMSETFKK